MDRRAPARLPRGPHGQITWVGLVLLLGLVGGAYLVYVWAPVWVVHYEVKQVVRDFMNQAVRDREDSALVERMAARIRALDTLEREDAQGRPERVPAVDLRPEDVRWLRDGTARPPSLHVAFSYTREITYPWLERTVERTFEVELLGDLDAPSWGTQR